VIRIPQIAAACDQGWLDLNKAASVEVSSEDQNYPIESALLGDEKTGWRAAKPGTQTIRLIFDSPQNIRRILLAFEDSETFRTQEFVLRWSSRVGQPFREIVRQQWNFSSPGGVREIEDYIVQGGAGAVGACAVQLAHRAGARVIASCRAESDKEIASRAGADEVLLTGGRLG